MRLDIYLSKNLGIQSRNKAQELIKANKVKVNNTIIKKTSYLVEETDSIELFEDDFFVSRAAYKLKYFLEEINIDIKNKKALDIGSSTGGFTQILLRNEVLNITCVDVGSNQLHETLRDIENITFNENCDIRDFKSDDKFDVITCDVSFISIHNILSSINELSKDIIIILFKPQFEVGISVKRDKRGVVLDKNAISKARSYFVEESKKLQWKLQYSSQSKLQGKDGNHEELFYFTK